MANKDNPKGKLEDFLVIRTMRGDLARIRGKLEGKERELPGKEKEVPRAIPEEKKAEIKVELPKKKEEVVRITPPPLGLPSFERRPPTPPAPPTPPKPPVFPPKPPEEKPAPPKPKVPEVPKAREIPEVPKVPKALKVSRVLLLGGIVAALVVAVILIYWFLFASPKPSPPSPPSPPQELIKPVSLIPVQRQIIIELEEDQEVIEELKKQIEEEVSSGLTQILIYKDSLISLSLEKVFEEFGLRVPQALIDDLNEDYTLLLFAQEELLTEAETPRLGFITQVKNATSTTQIMRIWEDTMAEDLSGFYLVPRGEQATEEFYDSTHKDINIRYLNFSLPDITIDYALYPEENWLIFTTSREFIYHIIDLLEEEEIEEL